MYRRNLFGFLVTVVLVCQRVVSQEGNVQQVGGQQATQSDNGNSQAQNANAQQVGSQQPTESDSGDSQAKQIDLGQLNNSQMNKLPVDPTATQMTPKLTNVSMEGNWMNTNPVDVQEPFQSPIKLKTGSALLSGDWITLRRATQDYNLNNGGGCYLTVTPNCVTTSSDPNCPVSLATIYVDSSSNVTDTSRFQMFTEQWDNQTLTGYIALKDSLGRWVTSDASGVIYIDQVHDVDSFEDSTISGFRMLYLTGQDGGTNGFWRLYRNYSVDAFGQTEPVYMTDDNKCENASVKIGPPGDPAIDNGITSWVIASSDPPHTPADLSERMVNTRFDFSQVQNSNPDYAASHMACNSMNTSQQIQLTYSFMAQAVSMLESQSVNTVGVTAGIEVSVPSIVSIFGMDYKYKVETTYTHSWVHGSSRGWWNSTTLGMNSWLMVPPNTLANISIVSNYAYAMNLPFTATYQRMYTDGSIFTYQIDGSWTQMQYWEGDTQWRTMASNVSDCSVFSTFSNATSLFGSL